MYKNFIAFIRHIKDINKWFLAKSLTVQNKNSGNIFLHNFKKTKKLAFVCIVRNEDQYLLEWLNFHYLQGVDCVVLYDNAIDDQKAAITKKLLQQYISKKILIYIRWPDIPSLRVGTEKNSSRKKFNIQELAYFHFHRYYSKYFDYYAKVDIDEFIYNKDGSLISNDLIFNGVCTIWGYNFGSSGAITNELKPVSERFKYRSSTLSHAKTINKSSDVYEWFNAHTAFLYPWKLVFNRSFDERPLHNGKLRLNHYRIKSKEEFMQRKVLNISGFTAGDYSEKEFYELDEAMNIVYDDAICSVRHL